MMASFYENFHPQIEKANTSAEKMKGERLLGIDPASGKNIYVKIGRFGAMAQIGEAEDSEKPKFASLKKSQSVETITLEETLDLFKLPRVSGSFENEEMTVAIGKFGPYVRHNKSFYSIPKTLDPMTITETECIEIIEAKRNAEANKLIQSFENDSIQVINGRYGAYISYDKGNYKIPKTIDAAKMTLEEAKAIIADDKNKTNSAKKTKK
jgi:DNA topoisomerase-1